LAQTRISFFSTSQTGYETHPPSYSMGSEDSFSRGGWVKQLDHKTVPSSAKVGNGGITSPLPQMHWGTVLN
jgi:hypothetical protein